MTGVDTTALRFDQVLLLPDFSTRQVSFFVTISEGSSGTGGAVIAVSMDRRGSVAMRATAAVVVVVTAAAATAVMMVVMLVEVAVRLTITASASRGVSETGVVVAPGRDLSRALRERHDCCSHEVIDGIL